MGSNLQYKGLKEVLDNIGTTKKDKELSVKEVNKEWKRLASFMAEQK